MTIRQAFDTLQGQAILKTIRPTMKNTLSLTLIVKNEEQMLARALQNAHLYADEIVIVDTGSTDSTKEIAKKFTDKVYDFEWCDDFAKARNFGVEKCQMDFVMWLDADDVITDEDAHKIKQLLSTPIEWIICSMPYHLAFDAKNKAIKTFSRERIFRNHQNIRFRFPIHEHLDINPSMRMRNITHIAIFHKPAPEKVKNKFTENRNLNILLKILKQPEYSDIATLWMYLGDEYARRGNTEDAIRTYQTALEKYHQFKTVLNQGILSKIHYVLGLQLCIMKRSDEALAHFGSSMTIYPLWREPVFECGRLLCLLKRPREALQFFMFCQTIPLPSLGFIETDKRLYDGPVYYDWLSVVHASLGDFANAIRCVGKALTFSPTDARLLNNKTSWERSLRHKSLAKVTS